MPSKEKAALTIQQYFRKKRDLNTEEKDKLDSNFYFSRETYKFDELEFDDIGEVDKEKKRKSG